MGQQKEHALPAGDAAAMDTVPTVVTRKLGYKPQLDGVRGIAVLSVVGYHLFGFPRHGGLYGVGFFFVLSGFLITTLLLEECESSGTISIRKFYMRRALRLLPVAYVGTVVITAVSILSGGDQGHYLRSAISVLLYIGNYFSLVFRGYGDLAPGLGHFWTLAVEEQFYLVWPVVLLAIYQQSSHYQRPLIGLTIGGIVAGVLLRAVLIASGKTVWAFTPTHIDALLLGALLAQMRFGGSRLVAHLARLSGTGLLLGISAVVGLSNQFDLEAQFGMRYTMVAVLGVALLLVADGDRVPTVLTFGPLVRVGRFSYGLYVIHWPVWLAASHILPTLGYWTRGVIALVVSLMLSELSFRWFELYFLQLKRRFSAV